MISIFKFDSGKPTSPINDKKNENSTYFNWLNHVLKIETLHTGHSKYVN